MTLLGARGCKGCVLAGKCVGSSLARSPLHKCQSPSRSSDDFVATDFPAQTPQKCPASPQHSTQRLLASPFP